MNYFIVIIPPIFLYLIENFIKTKEKLFEKIAIFYIILITSLRVNFGADYQTYLAEFNSLAGKDSLPFEWGYSFLNIIVYKSGLPFSLLLLLVSSINYILLYKTINKNFSRYRWLSIYIFLTYFDLFFYLLSAIRQSIAVGIFMFSTRYIEENKFKKYIICILVASLFHKTSLILIPIYFIVKKLLLFQKKDYYILLLGILLVYNFIFNKLLYIIKPYLSQRYIYYFFLDDSSLYGRNWIYIIILIPLIIFWINIITKEDKKIKHYGIYIYIFLVLKLCQGIKYFSVLPRIQLYFYCFYILIIPLLIEKQRKEIRIILIACILIFQNIFFMYKLNMNKKSEFYKNYNFISKSILDFHETSYSKLRI